MNTATPATTAARLIVRLAIGSLFLAHGLQKFNEYTLAGTAGAFAQMGVPAPEVLAPIAASIELVGGILLIVGLLTRPAALALTVLMAGALFTVHIGAGVFVENGGFELVLALGAAALALFLVGPGRISLDAVLFGRRQGTLAKLA
ncbi:DoxX family protein [Zhihengliuella somnathii]